MIEFSEMLDKIILMIEVSDDKEILRFHTDDGTVYQQYHMQDCCESVQIEEIIGDLDDLIGSPILLAEEVTYDNKPAPDGRTGYEDDYCWTFYKLATIKGHVTIRWLGQSNGYYSTAVYFDKVA